MSKNHVASVSPDGKKYRGVMPDLGAAWVASPAIDGSAVQEALALGSVIHSASSVRDRDPEIISAEEIRATLGCVLSSDIFSKAQRMRHLLKFLVEQAIAGSSRETQEYAIGIDVFGRNPTTYNTGDDPIVRIQIGRLREKLKQYYAKTNVESDTCIKFSIPLGSYMPVIYRTKRKFPLRQRRLADENNWSGKMLALLPLRSITPHAENDAFTCGLNEELAYQLFKEFGSILISSNFILNDSDQAVSAGITHFLEGSTRIDDGRTRVVFRVLDASSRCIVWSEQFDRNTSSEDVLDIALQEEFASAICKALLATFFERQ